MVSIIKDSIVLCICCYFLDILFISSSNGGDRETEKECTDTQFMAFVICLLMSFAAEYFFGVADITGAFFAGVIISMTQEDQFYCI